MRSRSQCRVTASPSSAIASSTWGFWRSGSKPGAQLGDVDRLDVGERAEHGHSGERPDGVLDDPTAVVVGHVVEDHADDASGAVQLLDPERGGGRGLTHRPGVDHQNHRRRDDACDLERAAGELGRAGRAIGRHAVAVEQAHRALDDHAVGSDRAVHERAPHPFRPEHPGIEVATRPAAGMRQVCGVDEIGADLEGLDGATARCERGGETQADRGFPGTRTQAADHEPRNPDLLEHEVPPDCAGDPADVEGPALSLTGSASRRARTVDASTGRRRGQVQSCNGRLGGFEACCRRWLGPGGWCVGACEGCASGQPRRSGAVDPPSWCRAMLNNPVVTDCCSATGYRWAFSEKRAWREARRYERRGLDPISQCIVELLTRQGVEGLTLLEVGGGVGAVQIELLKAGVTQAVSIELTPTYEKAAGALLRSSGLEDRVERKVMDFATAADDVNSRRHRDHEPCLVLLRGHAQARWSGCRPRRAGAGLELSKGDVVDAPGFVACQLGASNHATGIPGLRAST